MFVIAAVIHFLGVAFYAMFASGELQPWAEPPPEVDSTPAPPVTWNPMDNKQGYAETDASSFDYKNNDYNTTVMKFSTFITKNRQW